MTDQFHATTEGEGGNPLSEGLGDTARHGAELAAAAAMAMQMWVRARDQREQARQAEDERAAQAARAELRADQGAARLGWAPALEPQFARTATAADAMGAWAAAQPWVDHDATARDASERAEARLEQLHPDLMADYRHLREQGMVPPAAMVEAGRSVSSKDWQDVLDPARREQLGVDDTLRSWNAARPWAEVAHAEGMVSPRSEEAVRAMALAEDRLRTLRPGAMVGYDDARAMGVDALEAMQAAAPDLRQQVWQDEVALRGRLDTGEAEVDRTVAQQQRGAAAHDLSQADVRSTPADERAVGATQGANHLELADARGAQAESLVGRAYPETIHTALARTSPAQAPAARLSRAAAPSQGRRR